MDSPILHKVTDVPMREVLLVRGHDGKWLLETSFQSVCDEYSDDRLYVKVTYSNGREYRYKDGRVKRLRYKDVVRGRFMVKKSGDCKGPGFFSGRQFRSGELHLYGSGEAVAVRSDKGELWYYKMEEVQIRRYMSSPSAMSVFSYLAEQSVISVVGEGENKARLRDRYDSVQEDGIPCDTLLASYCDPSSGFPAPMGAGDEPLVFPFGCNASQLKAVETAFSSGLSVIQGPPGTGKTQTILNIIANLLIREKTCLVVSNNNKAVDNVVEKLSKPQYGMDFLIASLGGRYFTDGVEGKKRERFLASQTGILPPLEGWLLSCEEESGIRVRLSAVSSALPARFEAEASLALLRERRDRMRKQILESWGPETLDEALPPWSVMPASFMRKAMDRCTRDFMLRGRPGIVSRLMAVLCGLDLKDIDVSLRTLAVREFRELEWEMQELETIVRNTDEGYRTFTELSLRYVRSVLARRFAGAHGRRRVFDRSDLMNDTAAFLKEYPVVTSTSFSATSCIGRGRPFDCLIMDEASQADIAAGALSLCMARTAVIVGDPEQLPNVQTEEDLKHAHEVYRRYALHDAYRFAGRSFLASVMNIFGRDAVPVTFLREHYRCHPDIIGFCNRQFYDNQLLIMTSRDGSPAVQAVTTVRGNHARGAVNTREAQEVVKVVKELHDRYKGSEGIGVIAPFRKQVAEIESLLKEEGIEDVDVATIHKFQGAERDAIVMCTVSNERNDFVDDPHLMNVAVSRARRRLVLVTTGNEQHEGNAHDLMEWIRSRNGEVKEGMINSVFDLLYGGRAEERMQYLEKVLKVSVYDSEKIMYRLIMDALKENDWEKDVAVALSYPVNYILRKRDTLCPLDAEERRYAWNDWTHLDFYLYSSKEDGKPLLAIEVDGHKFHKAENEQARKQSRRDGIKDRVMEKLGIRLIRFATTGSGERERLQEALREQLSLLKGERCTDESAGEATGSREE